MLGVIGAGMLMNHIGFNFFPAGDRGQFIVKYELPLGYSIDETLAVGARTLWLQLGSWHEDVARRAEEAGLDVVMDRCVKIEHARFHGGLHLAGFDTGVISSRRGR